MYGEELAKGGDENEVLQRAGERTADLRGCRAASDGSVVTEVPPRLELEGGPLTAQPTLVCTSRFRTR